MASGIVNGIAGDVDQASLDQVQGRIEESGGGPVEELATVPELLVKPEVMTCLSQVMRDLLLPGRECGSHPEDRASRTGLVVRGRPIARLQDDDVQVSLRETVVDLAF